MLKCNLIHFNKFTVQRNAVFQVPVAWVVFFIAGNCVVCQICRKNLDWVKKGFKVNHMFSGFFSGMFVNLWLTGFLCLVCIIEIGHQSAMISYHKFKFINGCFRYYFTYIDYLKWLAYFNLCCITCILRSNIQIAHVITCTNVRPTHVGVPFGKVCNPHRKTLWNLYTPEPPTTLILQLKTLKTKSVINNPNTSIYKTVFAINNHFVTSIDKAKFPSTIIVQQFTMHDWPSRTKNMNSQSKMFQHVHQH